MRLKKLLLIGASLLFGFAVFFFVSRDSKNPFERTIGPTTPVKITPVPNNAAIIAWSTRNARVPLGPSCLFTMNVDGSNVTQITFDPRPYEHAAVSHDRRYIAADRFKEDGSPYSLWVLDVEKQTEARLVPDFYAAAGGGMDWSPDGFIFFAGEPKKDAGRNIFKIKPDGSELAQLTHYLLKPSPPPDPAQTGDVSVSEDGSRIAYMRVLTRKVGDDFRPNPQIWVMNADGTGQRMVYNGGEETGDSGSRDAIGAYDPEISPDGQEVVFSQTNTHHRNFASAGVNTAHDIYAIKIDGTGLRRLTTPQPVCVIPDWHDNKILFTEYNEPERYVGLVLINSDGTGKTRLEPGLELWRGGRHGKFIPPLKQ